MSGTEPTPAARRSSTQADSVVELLLAEHAQCYEMYRFSEELGERRFNFFLTVVTAALAAVVVADRPIVEADHRVWAVAYVVLGALLLLGAVTLARIAHRNENSSAQLRAIATIRSYFRQLDSVALSYLDFDRRRLTTSGLRPESGRVTPWSRVASLGTAGLAETMQLINAATIGGVAALGTFDAGGSEALIVVLGLSFAITGWIGQFGLLRRYHARNDARREADFTEPTPLPLDRDQARS